MSNSEANCLKCDSLISTEAIQCPKCGYEPRAEGSGSRKVMMFIGGLLTMTVIGAVIGIPMILFAYFGGKGAKDQKPTTTEP